MTLSNNVIVPDAHTRVHYLYIQQIAALLGNERDPQKRLQDRVAELELAYTACPHYLESEYLQNYAKKHAAQLIARREQILKNFQHFHKDSAFVEHLKQHHPHLLLFAKWETVCLAIAEKHEAAFRDDGTPIDAPPRKKFTPEEWRANEVRKQQIKIDDKIALLKARLQSMVEAREIMEQYQGEDLNLGELEQELKADILLPQKQDSGGDWRAV